MTEFGKLVSPMGADCDSVYCSANPCGPGYQATMEYCYLLGQLQMTHCGCGYLN
ncbi:MAG: hypothetical protein Q8934_10400 [Bacillota bacterium]|nr:hypothetical protein [Bacillota bacterium]